MTFTLSSTQSTATVRTHGGELISFVNDGVEYVWYGTPEHWEGRAPILFPVCGMPKDAKLVYNGVEYPMPKHGFTRRREFEPIFISKSKVVLEQRETEETLKMFPFCYSLKVEHEISDTGFSTTFIVKNLDKNPMTFCIGGHPAFNCPLRESDGGFEDYSLYFDDANGCTVSLTEKEYINDAIPHVEKLNGTNELPLVYSDYDNDAMFIEYLPKKSVRLLSRKTGKGIRFNFDGFDVLGLWTPVKKNSPFICLEPWNGLPANLKETTDANSKKYAITIASGEQYSVGYSIELIK